MNRYPKWSLYLAGIGAFVFLAALLALMAMPQSEPPSVLENVLWASVFLAFVSLLPLLFLQLKAMVSRLGRQSVEENNRSSRPNEPRSSDKSGRTRSSED